MLSIAMAVDLTTSLLAVRELQIYADAMGHTNPLLKSILLENLFDSAGESLTIATLYPYAVSKYIYGVASIAISALLMFYAYRLARECPCTCTIDWHPRDLGQTDKDSSIESSSKRCEQH